MIEINFRTGMIIIDDKIIHKFFITDAGSEFSSNSNFKLQLEKPLPSQLSTFGYNCVYGCEYIC